MRYGKQYSGKNQDPMDLENIGIEQWGSMEKVDFSMILRYVLFQISKSKSMSSFKSYAEMVELLEIYLTPYADERYKIDIENLEKQKKAIISQTNPRKVQNIIGELEMNYIDKKLSVLVKLMARNGFLAEKSIMM